MAAALPAPPEPVGAYSEAQAQAILARRSQDTGRKDPEHNVGGVSRWIAGLWTRSFVETELYEPRSLCNARRVGIYIRLG